MHWTPTRTLVGRPAARRGADAACPTPRRTRRCCGCSPTASWSGAAKGAAAPGSSAPFWTAARSPEATRLDLLRRLSRRIAPARAGPPLFDTVAGRLAADPTAVQPLLVRWFDDERPLPATPHATVATAAQALLHTHRTAPGRPGRLTEDSSRRTLAGSTNCSLSWPRRAVPSPAAPSTGRATSGPPGGRRR
ncbi:hypothetical protein LV779_05995 [Streptomyces thinghirensis]|nr:hypothetical protein [Streptomyces thinghirensis]